MTPEDANTDTKRRPSAWRILQRNYGKLVGAAMLVSLLLHGLSFIELSRVSRNSSLRMSQTGKKNEVKVRIVEQKPKKPEKKKEEPPKPEPDSMPKVLETPQTKTQKPDEADYVGNVDHQAKKETRVADTVRRDKAKDPGQKGNPDVKSEPVQQQVPHDKQVAEEAKKVEKGSDAGIKSKVGKLAFDHYNSKPRNDYEALLPSSPADLPGQMNAGYQDYVDDKVAEGDRIDINTTEYRYIGYFTNMRKAIELVWNYPLDAARRGMQGEVGLEFAINKDGRASGIRVIKSSGYEILDKAIVEAIKLASPFAPLPEGFRKNRLVITGSFRYILSSH